MNTQFEVAEMFERAIKYDKIWLFIQSIIFCGCHLVFAQSPRIAQHTTCNELPPYMKCINQKCMNKFPKFSNYYIWYTILSMIFFINFRHHFCTRFLLIFFFGILFALYFFLFVRSLITLARLRWAHILNLIEWCSKIIQNWRNGKALKKIVL